MKKMRIPLTKYGLPQVVVFPIVIIVAMTIIALGTIMYLPAWLILLTELVLTIILIWVLMFFRDPQRSCPGNNNLLLAPADGRITDIEQVHEEDFVQGLSLRIGIFLSIFNVHINRSPCNAKIERITYKQGKYLNAMNPDSGRINESNNLLINRTDNPRERLLVRQISGAIARRIVCAVSEGEELTGGQRFGMIKFGSRTELYVPISSYEPGDDNCEKDFSKEMQYSSCNMKYDIKCLVKAGDKVRAGLTPLVEYIERDAESTETKS